VLSVLVVSVIDESCIGDVPLIELIEVSEPVESEPEEELDFELQDIANVATMLAKRMYFFIVFCFKCYHKKMLLRRKKFCYSVTVSQNGYFS